jgi:OOP family OmpA-OmpF porin
MNRLLSHGAAVPLRRYLFPGLATLVLTALWSFGGTAQALPGYLTTEYGEIVRNDYGECWHTERWRPEIAVPECEGTPVTEAAAPEVVTLTLDEKAFFDFDRSVVKVEARRKLDALIEQMGGAERIGKVLIVGHADRIGTEAYNEALSMRRAVAVRDYLLERGLASAEEITLEARGESEPVVACEGIRGKALIECLAPNRRVEVTVEVQRAP